ncbi:MAG: UDP-N-acetylmuramoyl-L-alanine--D-glutamate ligase [Bacteroidales bacterium]
MNEDLFRRFFENKRVALLGFGQEGQSSFRTLKRYLPGLSMVVCDQDPAVEELKASFDPGGEADWHLGPAYLEGLGRSDIVIRSPGIPFRVLNPLELKGMVTSQTDIFLSLFRPHITGITGTKGKSTTAALLHHVLQTGGLTSILAGNIGIPPFELIPEMEENTHVVFEMSSHQLQPARISPHMAVWLNLFAEHLDHYASFEEYARAKMNIFRWQKAGDFLFYNPADAHIPGLLSRTDIPSTRVLLGRPGDGATWAAFFEGTDLVLDLPANGIRIDGLARKRQLPGEHNLINIAAAAAIARIKGVDVASVVRGVESFRGLPHRLEFTGEANGVSFYNDSISTVPESTMAAIKTFPQASALILGGFDRGVEYGPLMAFLGQSDVKHLVFLGDAGRRMMDTASVSGALRTKHCFLAHDFDEAFRQAAGSCQAGEICLLSPAAASYDSFRNFKERGERFRQLVEALQ